MRIVSGAVESLAAVVGVRAGTEEPPYTVLERINHLEIRRYGARIAAETTVHARVYAGSISSRSRCGCGIGVQRPPRPLPDGRTISFAFANDGHDDGADFVTDCADHLQVGPATVDNVLPPPQRIYPGGREIHPEHNPVTIHRTD